MPNPYTLLSEIPKQAKYDFKTIEKILGHYMLLLHLDSSLWGLAWPLYKLITETQQVQTNNLVWSPETQKACKVLQTAFLQAPTLNFPIGSKFGSLLKIKAMTTLFKSNCYYHFTNA